MSRAELPSQISSDLDFLIDHHRNENLKTEFIESFEWYPSLGSRFTNNFLLKVYNNVYHVKG